MEPDSKSSDCSAVLMHIPFTLLTLAVFFYLLLEHGGVGQARESLKVQIATIEKRYKTLQESSIQLDKAITDRKPAVDQSEQTQNQFTKIMADLVELAKIDSDAKAIVDGYGIRYTPPNQNAPAAAEPAK